MTRTDFEVGYAPKSDQAERHNLDRDCSSQIAEEGFGLLEGRWKMGILFHLFDQTTLRFSELERLIPRVSQKMLTQQLRELERDGIVNRAVYAEVPPKVEYSLTDLGQELRPALHELVMWAASRRKTLDSEKNTHNVVAK